MPLPAFWLSSCDPCLSYVKMKEPERKLTPCPLSSSPQYFSTNKGKDDLDRVRLECTSENRFAIFRIGARLPVHTLFLKRKTAVAERIAPFIAAFRCIIPAFLLYQSSELWK